MMPSATRKWTRRLAIGLAVVAVWEVLFRAGVLNPLIFGSPSLVAAAVAKDGLTFLGAFDVTIREILVATAIAWIGGVACGVVVGASPLAALTLTPILSAAISVPLVVLYPVMVAWVGIGPVSKVIYGAAMGFFPIALSTLLGIRSIDKRYASMAVALGASRLQILLQVMVPLAIPSIVSGLRIGTSLVIIGVIQSEMLSATDGLGFWISYHRSLFNVGQVYLGLLLALVAAAAANAGLSMIERHYSRWRIRQQDAA
jgi:NitT/TauT family transport system permease protein